MEEYKPIKIGMKDNEDYEFSDRVVRKDGKIDIEGTLRNGVPVIFSPNGFSMYPVIYPGRDYAEVVPFAPEKLKRGDVAIYRRPGSILVIHRVWKHKKDGIYMVGDNQKEIEGPLSEECFFGKMTHLHRKGKRISVKNIRYVIPSRGWLFLRPFRQKLMRFAEVIKNLIKGGKK